MDPDRKRQLDRILSRQKLRTGLIGGAILAPVLGLLLVLVWPSPRSGEPQWAEVIAIGTAATDDAPPRRLLTLLLADGGRDLISATPAETPGIGGHICVVRVRNGLTGAERVRRVRPSLCSAPSAE